MPAVTPNRSRRPLRLKGTLAVLAAGAPFLLSPGAAAQGLDPRKALTQFKLDVWTTAEDLPQNSVTALVQTRDGYVWLGTYGGLGRFDGVRFTVFDTGNTPQLRSNGIQALLEDSRGALWIGTNGGGLSRFQDGRFTTFTAADGLSSDIVRSLHEDRDGSLWIGTNDGLCRFRNGRFTVFTAKDGLANGVVRAIEEDASGVLWIGTNGGGLERREGERFRALTTKDGLPSNFIFALLRARGGAFWIGTNGGGLCRWKDGRLETFTTREGLPSNIIWSLHEDAQGSLWVGTYGGGIARFRDGKFTSLTTREGLSNDFVRAVWSDREGSLWIGTYSGGLCRLRDGKFTTYTTREGLSHDFARTILEDRSGSLWIGTTGGGLCRMRQGALRCYGAKDGLAPDVRALHEDGAGVLWVGTAGSGLFRAKDGSFTRYTTADGLANHNVSAISGDGQGGLWIGTNGGGLSRFAGGRWTTLTTADGLAGNFILATHVDRNGTLWVGTDGAGLSRFERGRFTVFTRKDGLASDVVFCFHEDAGGTLWIGTSGGLSRFQDGKLTTYTTREGLLDDVVFQILEDGEERFWLSGNRGISRVARSDLDAVASGSRRVVAAVGFGTADGMKSNECSGIAQPAGWKGRDGRLWFPTSGGVVVVNPARIPRNTLPPPVKVEQVVVDGEPVTAEEVPPGKERWEFQYTALSFLAPGKVEFKYRLDGFDRDWIPAGRRRTAYYTRLPPGRYTFRVTASNNDGVWNEAGDTRALLIRPHFYETPWFYAFLGLVVVLGAAGTYRLRVSTLQARQRELEGLVEARTRDAIREKERAEGARGEAERARGEAERQKEIAQEADRMKGELLSIAAHDLKSPLQSIIGYTELMGEDAAASPVTREYAGQSARAAQRMLDIVNRLLQSDALERAGLPVVTQAVDVGRLALAVTSALESQAEAKKQRIHVSAPAPTLVEGDEEWLSQVLENLLGNAIKYSPPRRSIWLSVVRTPTAVRLEVRDEGPGLTEEDKTKLFGRFQRLSAQPTGGESATGLGLFIVKQLVELHRGRIWAESDGPGRGASFVVELPPVEGSGEAGSPPTAQPGG
jgi:signal transduction histidine kinase/ligand-binding sensor domain-containing protein